ncbi:MAG: ATP-binding protein [Actinomycetota bacterium]
MVKDGVTEALAPALLERDHELEALAKALSPAATGAGTLVLIEGPAGIGKTRLLDAAMEVARQSEVRVLSARGSRLERDYSFGVTLQLLADRAIGDDPFAGAASLARPLFTAGPEPPERPTGDAMFSLLHGLHWLVSNLAEREPLLLRVDDAHWADAPSLAFINYLAQRLDELPVAVVVAVRTGEPTEAEDLIAELRDRRPFTVLRPASLSAPAGFAKPCPGPWTSSATPAPWRAAAIPSTWAS